MQHTVMAVCEGNICRSPVVERALPTLLDGSVALTSAGTRAAVGQPIDPIIASLLARDGHPTTGFAARQLDVRAVARATIVLTMTVAQRAAVVGLVPQVAQRTFTLLELVHLLRASPALPAGLADDGSRWAAIPDLVAGARHRISARELDIADPYRRPLQRYERTYDEIMAALTEIAQATHARTSPQWDPLQARSIARSAPPRVQRWGSPPRHARR